MVTICNCRSSFKKFKLSVVLNMNINLESFTISAVFVGSAEVSDWLGCETKFEIMELRCSVKIQPGLRSMAVALKFLSWGVLGEFI